MPTTDDAPDAGLEARVAALEWNAEQTRGQIDRQLGEMKLWTSRAEARIAALESAAQRQEAETGRVLRAVERLCACLPTCGTTQDWVGLDREIRKALAAPTGDGGGDVPYGSGRYAGLTADALESAPTPPTPTELPEAVRRACMLLRGSAREHYYREERRRDGPDMSWSGEDLARDLEAWARGQ